MSAIAKVFKYIFLSWMKLREHGMPHFTQTAYQQHVSCADLCFLRNLAEEHKLWRQSLCIYRIVPGKHPPLCKRPPLEFDSSVFFQALDATAHHANFFAC